MRQIAGIFIIMAAIIITVPSRVRADWREFVPVITGSQAYLDVVSSYESENNNVAGQGTQWSDIFVGEKLTFNVFGYSYDPKFIEFKLNVAEVLKQEDFTESNEPTTGWESASATEYGAWIVILPDHPYTLRLFTYKTEPLPKTEFGVEIPTAETSTGAIFQYKSRPYFFNMSYIDTTTESSISSSQVDEFRTEGTYLKNFKNGVRLTLSGEYDYSSFSTSSTPAGTSSVYSFFTNIDLGKVGLTSGIDKSDFNQNTLNGILVNDTFDWREHLNATLPLHFTSDLSYHYTKNTSDIGDDTSGGGEVSSTDKGIEFNITHRLYNSLVSSYTFSHDSSVSSFSGEISSTSNALSFTYNKKIPWDGNLLAGFSLGTATVDESGQSSVVNESHAAIPVPGSFTLNQQAVDPTTIEVFLKSPISPFELVLLEENVNYIVSPMNNSFQITIISLPPQFIIPGIFDFSVTYDLVGASFSSQTNTLGYNVSLTLFNNLLNPYFSYSTADSRLLTGSFPQGQPLQLSTTTAGLLFYKDPWRALIEYDRFESNLGSSNGFRSEVTFAKTFAESNRITATAAYSNYLISQEIYTGAGQSYTEKTVTLSANMLNELYTKFIVLSTGGSFSYVQGLTKTTAYSFDTNLSWKVGRISLVLGASAYSSISSGVDLVSSRQFHQYYYLNMRRYFF